ncbi:hypothetical protein OCU04_003469 [Sclerotinia nivalis]|uniref:F-box domain-containing protein n=1 Tax=Sclerotinia nivalis TaxID=352851 RepID=A0A9X0ASY1_9HELO|nr:hypothetical protein OCU04_003469 [Sclerotinia nivalis]
MVSDLWKKRMTPRKYVLEPGMSSGGVTLGGHSIMLDSLSLSLRRKCIESLPTELLVELLLHWLDPGSAILLALTSSRVYRVYKRVFPEPINLNVVIQSLISTGTPHTSNMPYLREDLHGNAGILYQLGFNLWYPASRYIYYDHLKISSDSEKFVDYPFFGRFLSREVYSPTNFHGPENIEALHKLKRRYFDYAIYDVVYLRLTGVPLEYPHNLGAGGWNTAVMKMLERVVTKIDQLHYLRLKEKDRTAFLGVRNWSVSLRITR